MLNFWPFCFHLWRDEYCRHAPAQIVLCGSGFWTHGFVHARQVHYQLTSIFSPKPDAYGVKKVSWKFGSAQHLEKWTCWLLIHSTVIFQMSYRILFIISNVSFFWRENWYIFITFMKAQIKFKICTIISSFSNYLKIVLSDSFLFIISVFSYFYSVIKYKLTTMVGLSMATKCLPVKKPKINIFNLNWSTFFPEWSLRYIISPIALRLGTYPLKGLWVCPT